MDETIRWWFSGLESALDTLPPEAPFFRRCAEHCLSQGTLDFYRQLHQDACGDPDAFFAALDRVEGLESVCLRSGAVYRLRFTACSCPLHAGGYLQSPRLCDCSRQSILHALETLWPERTFSVCTEETILGGAPRCSFRITAGASEEEHHGTEI